MLMHHCCTELVGNCCLSSETPASEKQLLVIIPLRRRVLEAEAHLLGLEMITMIHLEFSTHLNLTPSQRSVKGTAVILLQEQTVWRVTCNLQGNLLSVSLLLFKVDSASVWKKHTCSHIQAVASFFLR